VHFVVLHLHTDGYYTVFIGNFPAKSIEGGKVQVACNESWIAKIMAPMFRLVRKYVDGVDKDTLRVPKPTTEYQYRDAGCLPGEQLVEEFERNLSLPSSITVMTINILLTSHNACVIEC